MKTILFLLIIALPTFGQKKVTDSLTFKNGLPKRQCYFNNGSKQWNCIDFYETGKPWQIYQYDSAGVYLIERKSIFDLGGELIACLEYKEGDPHGNFKAFYLNGNIKEKGQFNNGVRQGEWIEYYQNNKIKSIRYYKVDQYEEAGAIYQADKSRLNRLKIIYCIRETEEEQQAILMRYGVENMLNLECIDDIFAVDGIKTGRWKWYDANGKLIKIENH